jgi:hypothetical protein
MSKPGMQANRDVPSMVQNGWLRTGRILKTRKIAVLGGGRSRARSKRASVVSSK